MYCEKYMKYFWYLGILTSSFDIFAVFHLGGTVRFCQLILILPFMYGLASILCKKEFIAPVGFGQVCLWFVFIVAFIPNVYFVERSIVYAIWLLFNILVVFFMVNCFSSQKQLEELLKVYIISFAAVSLFGLYQFFSPIFGFPPLLIAQWWIPGVLARINGFSYEPSFFATYLIFGWSFNFYLLKKNIYIINRRILQTIFIVETITLILSGSRTAWLIIALVYMEYPLKFAHRLIKKSIHGQLEKIFFKKWFYSFILLCFLGNVFAHHFSKEDIQFLFSGIGIWDGTPTHSIDDRKNGMQETFEIFLNNPLMGVSLGGIAPMIAKQRGNTVHTLEDLKWNEGVAPFIEVLAASGIVGFVPFVLYFVRIFKRLYDLSKRSQFVMQHIIRAILMSSLWGTIALQFSPNILRPYFWMHIAILSVLYQVQMKTEIEKERRDGFIED